MRARTMTARDYALNVVVGVAIAGSLAIVLHPAYEREQAERREIEQEWIREQRRAERAYLAEVEAERLRWEAIEAAERATEVTTVETAARYNDPEIPDEIEEAARKWGEVYGIAPEFLEAVAWRESRYDHEATNGGCVGLMQVAPRWHRDRMERLGVTEEGLMTVEGNMAVAADYLRELFDKYDDPVWVLMTYNGDSNADAFRNGTAPASDYATGITAKAAELTKIHEEGGREQ